MKNGNGFEPLKLNIGSGDRIIMKGYVNVDAQFGDAAYPLEYADGIVDEIYASHILEHFPQGQTFKVLKEWVRTLKPGGWMKIAVPNFEWIAKELLNGNPNDAPLGSYLMGGQTDEHDFHKAVFNPVTLRGQMESAGLTEIRPWLSEVKDCAALPVSLNLMGRKPEVANGHKGHLWLGIDRSDASKCERCGMEASASWLARHPDDACEEKIPIQFVGGRWYEENVGIIKDAVAIHPGVVLSRPRHGLLDAAYAFCAICNHLNAPPFISGGAWWDHGLTRSIENAMGYKDGNDNSLDVIVAMDFDTFARPNDALELVKLLYQNPQYDCLVPVQARRGHFQEILATVAGEVSGTDAIVPIMTGHFGLTVFRRRVFEQLKKPWFLNKPDRDGGWGDGRVEADIYFWNNFNDCGFKAGLATTVTIGHGEDAVVYPTVVDGRIEKKYISVAEWLSKPV